MKKDFIVDFIGIGAAKSGTTWVADMLNAHPDIYMSEPKEVRYFNELNGISLKYAYKDRMNKNFGKPLSWYRKHFQHISSNKIKGEFTPSYIVDKKAPIMIKKYFPNVKLIVSLRNPIDRAYSYYWQTKYMHRVEERTFEEALDKEALYIENGMYFKHIQYYLNYFNREQIMIVLFDDIVSNPESVIKKLYSFLGVDDTFIPAAIKNKSNYSKIVYVKGILLWMDKGAKLLVQIRMAKLLILLKKIKINKILLNLFTKKHSYPKMDPKARKYLQKVFGEDIRNLEKLLGRDLPQWH